MVTFYLLVLSLIILILILNNIILLLNFLFIILLLLLLLLINNIIPITLLFVLIYSSLLSRFHAVFSLINKLRFDISLFFIDSFIYRLLYYIRKLKEIHNILSINRLWRTRLYEIGIVDGLNILIFVL